MIYNNSNRNGCCSTPWKTSTKVGIAFALTCIAIVGIYFANHAGLLDGMKNGFIDKVYPGLTYSVGPLPAWVVGVGGIGIVALLGLGAVVAFKCSSSKGKGQIVLEDNPDLFTSNSIEHKKASWKVSSKLALALFGTALACGILVGLYFANHAGLLDGMKNGFIDKVYPSLTYTVGPLPAWVIGTASIGGVSTLALAGRAIRNCYQKHRTFKDVKFSAEQN